MTLFGNRRDGAPVEGGAAPQDDGARWANLARRIAQGDRSAEAELAGLFYPRVRVFACARLHGSDASLDIAQETILAVIEALRAGRLRTPYNLPGFVLGTARNLVNNHHRKQAKAPEVLEGPPDRPVETDGQRAGLDNERRGLVRKALGRLNALDRRILLLTLVEGMHPREIAPIVGLKAGVVRTRKARAVKEVAGEIERATRLRPPDHMGMSGPRPGAGK